MRRMIPDCVIWSATHARYEVQYVRPKVILIRHDILPGTAAWFAWLARIPSFAFRGKCGHFTARKESRARGSSYWIAYRHNGGKLVKRYIGPTEKVTTTHLEEIASSLALRTG